MKMTSPLIPLPKSYGQYGGLYLPESLMAYIHDLADCFHRLKDDETFSRQLDNTLKTYAGRETPLTEAKRFQQAANGPRVFLKREDLLHTGAHKINNVMGQCLLAKAMGKQRIVCETGAGQHGVATATVCAHLGLDCVVYMGKVDMIRQSLNVEKMGLLGAEVVAVETGAMTLKEAVNASLRDMVANFPTSHLCLGSALGPYPYPQIVAHFQAVIGRETAKQCQQLTQRLPDRIIAAVGGGSNAIGIFTEFIDQPSVKLIGVEAGGKGDKNGEHAARFRLGRRGVLHGCYSYLLQDTNGQVLPTHSISAGLDYPMVGPQHAELYDSGRAHYSHANDEEAKAAFKCLSRCEGIIPALESSHALAYYLREAKQFDKNEIIIINLSGRGDKDLSQLITKGERNEP